jgi:TolB-like protein/DNA-binding winged helix-turn-helix (wHTH) protein
MPPATRRHFGTFDLDIETGELRRNGLKLKLQEKPFQMLAMLLEHPGEVVTREALRERLWAANTIVDFDHGLNTAIKKLRQALGDSAESPRFIETLARRGYRFIAPVADVGDPGANPPVDEIVETRAPLMRRGLVAVLGIAAALVVVTVILMSRRPVDAPVRAGAIRLAVLPFENLGTTEDDYFVGGITDQVRGKLTNLPGLEVIARTSSNEYGNSKKNPREIGEELGVEYLLTGAVRFAKARDGARRVQVSSELSLASSGALRWAQPFDETMTDVFQVQGQIATRVAEALDVALSVREKRRLEDRSTQSLPAYESYLHGEEASQSMAAFDAPSLRRAVSFHEQAVALDPGFLEAWASLSRASSFLYGNGIPTPAGAERALSAAQKALALAPERADGHQALGYYYLIVIRNARRALPEM